MNDRTGLAPSRWRIRPFDLIRPTTLDEAIAAVDAGAVPLAGGLDLVDALKHGRPLATVVALSRVDELRHAAVDRDRLLLGAGLTHQALATLPLLRRQLPALADAWARIGNLRIRARGTLGGNLLAGQPAYEAALLLAALGARAVFAHGGRVHRVPIGAAPWPAGLMLGVEIPLAPCRLHFERSLRPEASLALAVGNDGALRIAIGGLGPLPLCSNDARLLDLTWPPACSASLRTALLTLIRRMLDADAAL